MPGNAEPRLKFLEAADPEKALAQDQEAPPVGVEHPPVDVAGHDPIIDPGHDASITLAGVTSLTADHLLFI
jgi:hypothetical protein